jgi:hypothetical protein
MNDLYKIADQLIAELNRIRKSGTPERTIQQYQWRILDYLEEKIRPITMT